MLSGCRLHVAGIESIGLTRRVMVKDKGERYKVKEHIRVRRIKIYRVLH